MKKFSLGRLCLVAVATGSISVLAAATDSDRLYQVILSEFPRYRALLLAKLGQTPFNCGRAMVTPAFAPEYSVSIYSRTVGGGEVKYFVTYVAADQSLWEITDAGRKPQEADRTNVRRLDCEIPKEIAENVQQAYLGMLTGDQLPIPMREEDVSRVTDATVTEFSIQVSAAETVYGEIPSELPSGPKTKALLGLANALVDYCKAKTTDRSELASRIDREATRLLEMIKHREEE